MADPVVITFDEAARLILRTGYLLGALDGNDGRVNRDEADLVRRAKEFLLPDPEVAPKARRLPATPDQRLALRG